MIQRGYYRVVQEHNCCGVKLRVGELVLVVGGSADKFDFLYKDHHFSETDFDDFESKFRLDPSGLKERQGQIAALMEEVLKVPDRQDQLVRETYGLLGPDEAPVEMSDSKELIVPSKPREVKRRVAETRNALQKFQKTIQAKQKELAALLEEQSTALELSVKGIMEVVERLEEAVWTINLYLGKDETILQLKKGVPAPKEEPISIRQLVLFMDEESVINAESGGLDFQKIEEFDKWVSDPSNLEQVLPEIKGMVAIKPRRRTVEYTNSAYANAEMNKKNLKTYFLLRNGENLYRIGTDLEVDDVLFPRRDEYDRIFTAIRYDWDTHKQRREAIRPGSREYMEAVEKADEEQRHYLRILLFLQGILDRTVVFRPLPVARLNVGNPETYEKALRFIHDAELCLPSGKKSFEEWFEDLNSKVRKGHRIVGAWRRYEAKNYVHISPKRADPPEDFEIYSVDEVDGGSVKFRYVRNDEIYVPYEGVRKSQKRASCSVNRDSRLFINYDDVDPADIVFYLGSRVDRHNYLEMFPLLRCVKRAKERELSEEEPFRKLLAGSISTEYGVSIERAERAVPDLVRWYKFKNKTKRGLKENDKKALRMIVREFGTREGLRKDRRDRASIHAAVVEELRSRVSDAIYIGHKRGSHYVALRAARTDENIWVHEFVYSFPKGMKDPKSLGSVQLREWTLVDDRHWRWAELWRSPRWDAWVRDTRMGFELTDPEVERIVQATVLHLAQQKKKDEKKRPIVITRGRDSRGKVDFAVWYAEDRNSIPRYLMTGEWDRVGLVSGSIDWERKKGEVTHRFYAGGGSRTFEGTFPWEPGYRYRSEGQSVIWRSEENEQRFREEITRLTAAEKKRDALRERVEDAVSALEAGIGKAVEEKAYREFISEYGDPDLWPEHKKMLGFKEGNNRFRPHEVRPHLMFLIDRGVDPHGKSLRKLYEECKRLGYKKPSEAHSWDDDDDLYPEKTEVGKDGTADLPMDFVFDLEPKQSSEAEEVLDDSDDEA